MIEKTKGGKRSPSAGNRGDISLAYLRVKSLDTTYPPKKAQIYNVYSVYFLFKLHCFCTLCLCMCTYEDATSQEKRAEDNLQE